MFLFMVQEAHRQALEGFDNASRWRTAPAVGGFLRDKDGASRHPIELKYLICGLSLCPPKSEAVLYHNIGLWLDGKWRSNFVLANIKGAREPWAVITDEDPTLQTLWQYALRFRIEELFLDSKSGAFELEESKIRDRKALERLYLVVALAVLFATVHGMTVQLKGLKTQVDPH